MPPAFTFTRTLKRGMTSSDVMELQKFLNTHGFTVATAGNVTLTWAQNTSSGTATVVHAQSALYLQRIA